MRVLLIGLVLGFALGVLVTSLATNGEDPPAAPAPPASPPARADTHPQDASDSPRQPVQSGASLRFRGPRTRGSTPSPPPEEPTKRAKPSERTPYPSSTWTDEELLEGLVWLADGVLLEYGPGYSVRRFSRDLADQFSRARVVPPYARVEALLAAASPDLRLAGAKLAVLTRPRAVDRLATLARNDPEKEVREMCIMMLWRLPERADFWETFVAAARDPAVGVRSIAYRGLFEITEQRPHVWNDAVAGLRDRSPDVRRSALEGMGDHLDAHPRVRRHVVDATSDPDPSVRKQAVNLLGVAGPEGLQRAMEMLLAPDSGGPFADVLSDVVIEGGGVRELLDRKPSAAAVTALIDILDNERATELAGRYATLLPLYQPESDRGYEKFFNLAAQAKEGAFFAKVVGSPSERWVVRLSALECGLNHDATCESVMDAAIAALRDPRGPVQLRLRMILTIEDNVGFDLFPKFVHAVAAFRELSETDPSHRLRERFKATLQLFHQD